MIDGHNWIGWEKQNLRNGNDTGEKMQYMRKRSV